LTPAAENLWISVRQRVELFLYLRNFPNLTENQLLALGMHVCGFFQKKYLDKWGHSAHYNVLLKEADNLAQADKSFTLQLTLNQIRPLNHPIRRLVFMVKLLRDKSFTLLYKQLSHNWESSWNTPHPKQAKTALYQKLIEELPMYVDSYWNTHYLFEKEKAAIFLPLIGDDFKREVIVNGFFPLLYADISARANWQEIGVFHRLYAALSAAKSSKSRYLIHRFFGDTSKGNVLNRLDTEQGAYQLHRDFCIHYEASCEGCPFVERYTSS